jgi:hypothetical protein
MILIGSRALAYWRPDFKCREDADWDIVMDPADRYLFNDYPKIDYHWSADLNNQVLLDGVKGVDDYFLDHVVIAGQKVIVAPISWLAQIKRSHLWRDYFFDKHIAMYHKYLVDHCWPSDFLKERTRLTKLAYPQGNPSLNQSNEDFFDDAVKKVYDHDFIHELAAHYDKPLYTRLKYDDSKAWCEKDLWDQLSHEDKVKCVQEEAYVIATERFLVPKDWSGVYGEAYVKAVKKICTTLTSGWFRDFSIDNHPQIVRSYDKGKLEYIRDNLIGHLQNH